MLIYYVLITATTLNNYLIKNNLVSTFDFYRSFVGTFLLKYFISGGML